MDMSDFICAVRGPILLITIGALFALDHQTQFGFERTWPVLLIVFGVFSLLGRSARRSTTTPTPGGGK